jgi:hypothetical protein
MSAPSNSNEHEGFVERQIRRVSRRLFLANGIVLAIMAIIVFLLRTYLISFLQGPQLVDDAYILDAAKQPESGLIAYVEIRNHRLIPTGYIEESTQDGRVYSTMDYHFVEIGNKKMLVKATQGEKGDRLVGPLQFFSAKTDKQALEMIEKKNPALRGQVLPVMLNAAAAFNVFRYILLAVFIPLFALCLFNIARAILKGKTALHPVMRSLARHGDPTEIAQTIDAEIASGTALKVGKAFITKNWVLRPSAFRLIACRLDDIVWAYQLVISGDTIVALAFRDSRVIGISMRRNAAELLSHIYKRAPWAEQGWDKEKAKRWRTHRGEFIAEVEARRDERHG